MREASAGIRELVSAAVRRQGRDVWAATLLLVASLAFLGHLLATPQAGGGFVTTTTLPTAVAAVMTLLAAVMLGFALAGRSGPPPAAASAGWTGLARVALLIVWTALDVALMPLFGYLATTAAYIAGLALLFGSRQALAILALVLVVPSALLLFFERFMIVLLPSASLLE